MTTPEPTPDGLPAIDPDGATLIDQFVATGRDPGVIALAFAASQVWAAVAGYLDAYAVHTADTAAIQRPLIPWDDLPPVAQLRYVREVMDHLQNVSVPALRISDVVRERGRDL